MSAHTKRQNFDVTVEQEAEIGWVREALSASSAKEAILRSVKVLGALIRELRGGGSLYVRRADGEFLRILVPELEGAASDWKYLIARPHEWRRQLYVKGRKLLASTVADDLALHHRTPEETAENWDLPVEAVLEAVRYAEQEEGLIVMEAEEGLRRLMSKGLQVGV